MRDSLVTPALTSPAATGITLPAAGEMVFDIKLKLAALSAVIGSFK